jgi:type II secretory ATPase GspE/PulE/Tfp pilus assembly ATPase PilB-like protein
MDDLRVAARAPLAQQMGARWLAAQRVLPVGEEDGHVLVAAAGPAGPLVSDALMRAFGKPIRWITRPAAEIEAALLAAEAGDVADAAGGLLAVDADDLRALATEGPVVNLVNVLLTDAAKAGASDVHLEQSRAGLRVRWRLDGVLRDVSVLAPAHSAAAVSRVKLIAGLDIGERRRPQDGRARARVGALELDLRVSSLPTLEGESVAIRLLPRDGGARAIDALGLPTEMRARLERLMRGRSGLVLVTGPTGSGKSTTLYAALQVLAQPGVKVVTVEDPVEMQVPGVTQSPVNPRAGYGFPNALRAILRHDPDVVMVGEMRDAETAEMAVQASLTGHLVLSTLHTGDAPGAVTRLLDMGIAPYLVSATMQGVLAQRLVRRLCDACAAPATPTSVELAGAPAARGNRARYRRAIGCDACAGTGYKGRTGVYELLVPDEPLREAIAARARGDVLRRLATAAGWVPLSAGAWALAEDGITSVDEVLRLSAEEDA